MSEVRVDASKLLGYRLSVVEAKENGLDADAMTDELLGPSDLKVGDKLGGKAGGKTGGKFGNKGGLKAV